jgi:uncharacterized membrane protein
MDGTLADELRTGLPWLLGTGALFIVLGWGMQYVGPNHWYGVRIPATFADRRVWRDTNRRSGRLLMLVGAGTLAIGLWALAAPSLVRYVLAWLLGGVLAMAVDAFRYAAARLRHYRALDAVDAVDEEHR